MPEQFANNAQTTLSATIASGDVSLTVASATAFPTVGNFRIIVDSEIMLVSYVSGTTFYVTRAQENTTAASHTSGVLVTQVLTSGSVGAAFARLDQANDPSVVNGPNQLTQCDSSGLLPEKVTDNLHRKFRLLLLELVNQGFEFDDEVMQELDKL